MVFGFFRSAQAVYSPLPILHKLGCEPMRPSVKAIAPLLRHLGLQDDPVASAQPRQRQLQRRLRSGSDNPLPDSDAFAAAILDLGAEPDGVACLGRERPGRKKPCMAGEFSFDDEASRGFTSGVGMQLTGMLVEHHEAPDALRDALELDRLTGQPGLEQQETARRTIVGERL